MARFLEIPSFGAGLQGGSFLIGADQVMTVIQSTATSTLIHVDGGVGADLITLAHNSTGTSPQVRDAINYALSANPGGVKAIVRFGVTDGNGGVAAGTAIQVTVVAAA